MRAKLTKRMVDAIQPQERDLLCWDTELKGFGLKVTPRGRKVYVLQFRMGGQHAPVRRYTIGEHGVFTPESARKQAEQRKGDVRAGIDPTKAKQQAAAERRSAITVAELCDQYLRDAPAKKASTLATDRGRIVRHIVPLIGHRQVREVGRTDVQRFMAAVARGDTKTDLRTSKRGRAIVRGGKGTATRTTGLLGGIFSYAVLAGYRTDNPVQGIKRFPDRKVERFLSPAESSSLGSALSSAERASRRHSDEIAAWEAHGRRGSKPQMPSEAENPVALAAIRLLALTGCRKSEVLGLLWTAVDFERGCLNLPDSKTGPKRVPIGLAAVDVLRSQQPVRGNPYVFPGMHRGKALVGLPRVWDRIRRRAGLHDVRLHDLRHSFASVGAESGNSLLMISKLLGHRDVATSARYAHLAEDPVTLAANDIARQIAENMERKR